MNVSVRLWFRPFQLCHASLPCQLLAFGFLLSLLVPHAQSADAQTIAAPAFGDLSPMQTLSVAADTSEKWFSATANAELASGTTTPLPWQPSPVELPQTISPTIPFHIDCSAPATWLDRLNPSFSRSPSLSHASLTLEEERWPQGFASTASAVNCRICQAFHLSECFCLQPDSNEDPSMVGGSSSVPSAASIGSTFGAIRRHTGTIDLDPDEPATPLPEPAAPAETYWHLLNVGVPAPIAREAARRYLHDLDAALDWACSSDRRHTRPGLDSTDLMDVVDSSSEAGSGHVIGSPIALAPSSSLTGPNPSAFRPSVSSVALNECVGSPVVPSVPTVSCLSAIPAPPTTWLFSKDIPVPASPAMASVPHVPIAGVRRPQASADLSFGVPLPATSSSGALSVAAPDRARGIPENWSPVTVDDREVVDDFLPQRMPPPVGFAF